MENLIGKHVIVRCNRAGVFFAELADFDAVTRQAELRNCRRIYYWDGAASISQIAMDGVNNASELTVTVPSMIVMEVIELLPCSENATRILKNIKEWKR